MNSLLRTLVTVVLGLAMCAGTAFAYQHVAASPSKRSAQAAAETKKSQRCSIAQSSRDKPLIRARGKMPGQFATSKVITVKTGKRARRCAVSVGLKGTADSRAGRTVQRALSPYLWLRVQLQGQRYSNRKCARKRGGKCVLYRTCPRASKPSRKTAKRGAKRYCARVIYRNGPLLRMSSKKRVRVAWLKRGIPAKARVLVGLDRTAPGSVAGASARFDIVWYARPA